jgi:S-methylmethionine-dependent homocysteine/selenocysteine methylase
MNQSPDAAYERLQQKITRQECVVLDGGIGTELQRQGVRDFRLSDTSHWGFEAIDEAPDAVTNMHRRYVEAGCDVVTTNTYAILDAPEGKRELGTPRARPSHWMEMARKAILLARDAIQSW